MSHFPPPICYAGSIDKAKRGPTRAAFFIGRGIAPYISERNRGAALGLRFFIGFLLMSRESNNSGSCFLLQYPRAPLAPAAPQPLALGEIHAIGITTRKRSGEAAEAAFLARASDLGFGVARPWGDSERYDFILDSGRGFVRVQVKSTQRYAEGRYRVKAGGSKTIYTLDEIDFLAAYLIPEDLWYVVPVAAFAGSKGLRFYPHDGRKSLFEQYREAWCLLCGKCGADTPVRVSPAQCRCPELAVRCAVCPEQ